MNLVHIRNAKPDDLPISRATVYKWHTLGKHPKLIFKVEGLLVFDWDEWNQIIQAARNESCQKAQRLRKGLT